MIKVGIDKIGFYTPSYYIKLSDLAAARYVDSDKYTIGLGQMESSVMPPDEDVVTMAAAATSNLKLDSFDAVDWLIVATESGIDHSKSAALYVHRLLKMPGHVRSIEMKQACWSGTAALEFAICYIRANPTKKIVIVTSDFSKYGLNTPGESSQGAAAVALLISANPSIMSIDSSFGTYCKEAQDFWRPNYRDEAIINGRYSCDLYLSFLKKSYLDYLWRGGKDIKDLASCCFHTPFPKLAEKANAMLVTKYSPNFVHNIIDSLIYPRVVGNCYTASLFLSLLSLLQNIDSLANSNIGMYSYGSGSIGQFFSGCIEEKYRSFLNKEETLSMIKSRHLLTIVEYKEFYNFKLNNNGEGQYIPKHSDNRYRLTGINEHKRLYKDVNNS